MTPSCEHYKHSNYSNTNICNDSLSTSENECSKIAKMMACFWWNGREERKKNPHGEMESTHLVERYGRIEIQRPDRFQHSNADQNNIEVLGRPFLYMGSCLERVVLPKENFPGCEEGNKTITGMV